MDDNEIDRHIDALSHAVIVARFNYDIWWILREKNSRSRYVDVLNRYPVFWQSSIHAHFVALLIALYRIYETRKDSINLPQLLRLLEDSGTLDAAKLEEAKRECEGAKQLWVKVAILRNEAFGHERNDMSTEEVFRKAGVKPAELKKLLDSTEHIVNKLSRAWSKSTFAFNLTATHDTKQMLEDLRRLL